MWLSKAPSSRLEIDGLALGGRALDREVVIPIECAVVGREQREALPVAVERIVEDGARVEPELATEAIEQGRSIAWWEGRSDLDPEKCGCRPHRDRRDHPIVVADFTVAHEAIAFVVAGDRPQACTGHHAGLPPEPVPRRCVGRPPESRRGDARTRSPSGVGVAPRQTQRPGRDSTEATIALQVRKPTARKLQPDLGIGECVESLHVGSQTAAFVDSAAQIVSAVVAKRGSSRALTLHRARSATSSTNPPRPRSRR